MKYLPNIFALTMFAFSVGCYYGGKPCEAPPEEKPPPEEMPKTGKRPKVIKVYFGTNENQNGYLTQFESREIEILKQTFPRLSLYGGGYTYIQTKVKSEAIMFVYPSTITNDKCELLGYTDNHGNIFLSRECLLGLIFVNAVGANVDILFDNTRTVIDPAYFQHVFIHEVGHWLGMEHICVREGETGCTVISNRPGIAMMNSWTDINHMLPTTEPTELDKELFRLRNPGEE